MHGRAFDDVHASRDHLIAYPRCSGKVGILGFCMGGGFALVMATHGFDAAAPFYPSFPADRYDEILDEACPVVASFGGRDPARPGAGPRLEQGLTDREIAHDVRIYADAGHSFANPYPAAPLLRVVGFGYDQVSAEMRGAASSRSSTNTCNSSGRSRRSARTFSARWVPSPASA